MTATLRVPRSRGALTGVLLVLLGLWGALAPLIGPYFHFGFAPDTAWHLTSGRVWLQIVPGAAVFLGGLVTAGSGNRAAASSGAWLAALGGAWFAVGVPLSGLWADRDTIRLGLPLGDTTRQVTEQLTLLYGLGVVAVFLAAVAIGRLAVVAVRDAALAERTGPDAPGIGTGPEPGTAPGTVSDADAAPTVEQPRSALPRRKGPGQDSAPWVEQVPATPTEPVTPRTSPPSDVKVAGPADADETRDTGHPGAGA